MNSNKLSHIIGKPNPHMMNRHTIYHTHTPHSLISTAKRLGFKRWEYNHLIHEQQANSKVNTWLGEMYVPFNQLEERNRGTAKELAFCNRERDRLYQQFVFVVSEIAEIAEYRNITETKQMRRDGCGFVNIQSNVVITLNNGAQFIFNAQSQKYSDHDCDPAIYER